MQFEWDEAKNKKNANKHGICFETAVFAFADPLQVATQDRIENGEARWQTIGMVRGRLLLLVAHTVWDEHDGTEVIRIISARRADAKERKRYEQANKNS